MIPLKLPRLLIVFASLTSMMACLFINVEDQGKAILDAIPVYEGATLSEESQTTYPDSSPSIIREYQSSATPETLMEYYKNALTKQGWEIQTWDKTDPQIPKEILAEKDGWRISILIYSTGQFTFRVFLN